MSRPLRPEHPGAVWHVTARGNERRDIYVDDDDRREWLSLVEHVVGLAAWRVHAWVQMTNHYHLLLETPQPTLSRGMRQLNGVYGQRFNRRHGRVGHLFQGRFHAVLVQKESHLLELTRYVVLNPVRAGLVDDPADWPWSSYLCTAASSEAPAWLETAWTLAHLGGSPERYRRFVSEGRGMRFDPSGQIYFGTDAFVRRRLRAAAAVPQPEVPRAQRGPAATLDETLRAVLARLGTTLDDLHEHPRRARGERALVAYALRREAGATGVEIGRILGVSAWRGSGLAREGEQAARAK
jgi:putative transposase